MTVIAKFADKTACPYARCAFTDAPEEKGFCKSRHCPFPGYVKHRWLDQHVAEQAAMAQGEDVENAA